MQILDVLSDVLACVVVHQNWCMQIMCQACTIYAHGNHCHMPEGHTIHRLAREHTRSLAGHVLHVWSPQGRHAALAAALDGYALEQVEAYGKHLFYLWRHGPILHVH